MTLAILCLAAFAIVAYSISGIVVLALAAVQSPLERITAAARARVYLSAALLPLFGSLAILVTALAPTFGWIADHCSNGGDPHLHPHICAAHHVASWPGLPLFLLALLVSLRCVATLVGKVRALVLAEIARRGLNRNSELIDNSHLRVLPVEDAQAFVLGLFRPTLYITDGLYTGKHRSHRDAVIAHERAHIARRDPVRRFIAGIGLAFHLPGVAGRIDRALAQAQEMAADDQAAQTLGSRERIASALVAMAKARTSAPETALSFSDSDLEPRVVRLMDSRRRSNLPTPAMLTLAAVFAIVGLAFGADFVHHAVEIVLGAITI